MFAELLEECVVLPDAALDAALRDVELQSRAAEARRAALVAVAINRGSYRADGHRSINGYLRATWDSGDGAISRHRKLARLVDTHPQIGDALLAGRFSVDHAHQIARLHDNPRTRAVLAVIVDGLSVDAEQTPYREFVAQIDQLVSLVDQDGAFADLADDIERRDAQLHDLNGSTELRATGGDPITTAQLVAIFESFVEGEYQRDLTARRERFGDDAERQPLDRTPAQRRYDALTSIFAAAAATPSGSKLPEPTVHILIDEQSAHDALAHAAIVLPDGDEVVIDADADETVVQGLAAELVRDPDAYRRRRCETSTGATLHPMIALRALLTAHVRRVVVNSRGVVIDYGTRQRLFTGAAREAALLLAATCGFPGCRLPGRMCEVDHVTAWSAGGPTNQANAGVECGPHNVYKHTAGIRVRHDEHGRPFHLRPDGTIILPVGQRPPDLTFDEMAELTRTRLTNLRRAS